ncbi:MAG: DUF4168 domain-containing protein [Phenylobacterium sp.]|uniref:DUF4168 domain-containing protein n=1 Tax=Phenylobacterium sp. TaxID=1871053 RepID=UPI0008D2335E|nr:DUF4168 domain-containing protein [Phenylobacterium sp.]MBA4793456.1 DUF4168 domain-containing protein [Phenylobacterium sp.]OHB39820.1 MAG: hypothetical protein A2882_09150 [Phenylobacterium sp. RIFCSPHIGHO2_01_FULL_70_10]
MRMPSIALASALAIGLAAPALAQTAAPSQAPQPQRSAPGASSFSDDQVQSFAVAMNAVGELNKKYAGKLQSASGEQERQQVQQQAANEMGQAVTEAGITPQEYNQIAEAAQQDAELRARIGAAMQATGSAPR